MDGNPRCEFTLDNKAPQIILDFILENIFLLLFFNSLFASYLGLIPFVFSPYILYSRTEGGICVLGDLRIPS